MKAKGKKQKININLLPKNEEIRLEIKLRGVGVWVYVCLCVSVRLCLGAFPILLGSWLIKPLFFKNSALLMLLCAKPTPKFNN